MRAAALALVAAVAGCAPPPPPIAKPVAAPAVVANASALHLAGEVPPTPDGLGAPGSIVESLYDVCLDGDGRVDSVTPAPGLATVDETLASALRRWSWYVVAHGPRPCFRQSVLLGVPAAGTIVRQAAAEVSARALGHPATLPPGALGALYAGTIVNGVYKVCAGDDGRVASVRPVRGIAAGDDWAAASLRATRWEIVVGTLARAPYCFAAPVRLDFTTVARGPGTLLSLPPPKAAGVSTVVTR